MQDSGVDDLGVVLDRIDEAALPEGRPLDATAPPEPTEAPEVLARRWTRWWESTSDRRTVPWGGVPDVLSARWLTLAYCENTVWSDPRTPLSPFEVPAALRAAEAGGYTVRPRGLVATRDRVANARRAVLEPALELPPLEHLTPSPVTPEGVVSNPFVTGVDIGGVELLRWVLEGPEAALAWYASTPRDIDRWGATPVVRALVRSDGGEAPAIVDATTPARRLQASALTATPDEHAALLAQTSLDDVALSFNRHPVLVLTSLVSMALPLGPDERAALLARVDAHDDDAVRRAISWNNDSQPVGLALALFGEPMFERMVAEGLSLPRPEKAALLASRVSGPGAVGGMLRIAAADSESSPVARDWLAAHPAAVAAYAGHPDAEGARHHSVLADVARAHAAAGPSYAPVHPVAAAVTARVHELAALPALDADGLPEWWTAAAAAEDEAPVTVKVAKKLPASTPALTLRVEEAGTAARLEGPATEQVLVSAMSSHAAEGPRPLVTAVVDRMRPVDRDEAGGIVLRSWIGAGAPTRDVRLLVTAGFLGGDGVVPRSPRRSTGGCATRTRSAPCSASRCWRQPAAPPRCRRSRVSRRRRAPRS